MPTGEFLTSKEKICLYCGRTFIPKNSKAYFCKTSHRVAFYNRKKRRQRNQEAEVILKQMHEEFLASAETITNRLIRQEIEWEWENRRLKILKQAKDNERQLLKEIDDSEGTA
jgi:Flp pilus assembly CpaE family ATPase